MLNFLNDFICLFLHHCMCSELGCGCIFMLWVFLHSALMNYWLWPADSSDPSCVSYDLFRHQYWVHQVITVCQAAGLQGLISCGAMKVVWNEGGRTERIKSFHVPTQALLFQSICCQGRERKDFKLCLLCISVVLFSRIQHMHFLSFAVFALVPFMN